MPNTPLAPDQLNKQFQQIIAGKAPLTADFAKQCLQAHDNPDILFNLGLCYESQGKSEEAQVCYHQLAATDPEATFFLGRHYESQNLPLAVILYLAAAKKNYQLAIARLNDAALDQQLQTAFVPTTPGATR